MTKVISLIDNADIVIRDSKNDKIELTVNSDRATYLLLQLGTVIKDGKAIAQSLIENTIKEWGIVNNLKIFRIYGKSINSL